ncbi:hypothetical protein GCM10022254_47080 [Actinomadura meridiana]|uniref:Uncharacterized protein n=1 Tax=Actinomadura meridiana TaxID=559626 RepID=A0ABP8CAX7_9ACTN
MWYHSDRAAAQGPLDNETDHFKIGTRLLIVLVALVLIGRDIRKAGESLLRP